MPHVLDLWWHLGSKTRLEGQHGSRAFSILVLADKVSKNIGEGFEFPRENHFKFYNLNVFHSENYSARVKNFSIHEKLSINRSGEVESGNSCGDDQKSQKAPLVISYQ